MMTTEDAIQITVVEAGEVERTVLLTMGDVTELYNERLANRAKIQELEKATVSAANNLKYAQDGRAEAAAELADAHTLLTALGIKDKTDAEESYYRRDLKVATRIALYIAGVKNA